MSNAEHWPAGWIATPFTALLDTKSGNSKLIKGSLHSSPEKRLYTGFSASGQDVWLDHYEHEGEAIIVSAVGARCGKAFRASGQWSAIANTHIVKPFPGACDIDYLFRFINRENFWIKGGSAQPFVKVNATFEQDLLLPPLAEQTRIAAKLDELLAQVDTLKARIDGIPALLKRFRQSVLAAAVSGRLTEEWRKGRTAADFRDVELGNLIKEGPQNGIYKPSSAYGSGVKIIRIDSFYSGEITDWGRLRSLQVDPRELEAWGVRESDILINRVNSIEHLGKCALVRSVPEPAVFESNIMRMSLKRDVVHPEYLMRFLSSEVGRLRLIAKAKHAVNQASINQGDVKACKVPLPSIDEQTEIVRRVEQLFAFADQLEARLKAAQARIDRLTQSILAKAFRGELVPQDPNDEPASALLERIKAQRAAAPKARRGRRAATPS
ncbi:restriction endonuclease subunit S [Stutzerimonas stutzeri]|uniref:restriction endonuclease subunit S n=1 Tax=Stutzerimonas stutzeri TaxID=316 RepID=UPI001648A635|nr:restriction endonuclease subunit S [Stutzerimonas stutzeri]